MSRLLARIPILKMPICLISANNFASSFFEPPVLHVPVLSFTCELEYQSAVVTAQNTNLQHALSSQKRESTRVSREAQYLQDTLNTIAQQKNDANVILSALEGQVKAQNPHIIALSDRTHELEDDINIRQHIAYLYRLHHRRQGRLIEGPHLYLRSPMSMLANNSKPPTRSSTTFSPLLREPYIIPLSRTRTTKRTFFSTVLYFRFRFRPPRRTSLPPLPPMTGSFGRLFPLVTSNVF